MKLKFQNNIEEGFTIETYTKLYKCTLNKLARLKTKYDNKCKNIDKVKSILQGYNLLNEELDKSLTEKKKYLWQCYLQLYVIYHNKRNGIIPKYIKDEI